MPPVRSFVIPDVGWATAVPLGPWGLEAWFCRYTGKALTEIGNLLGPFPSPGTAAISLLDDWRNAQNWDQPPQPGDEFDDVLREELPGLGVKVLDDVDNKIEVWALTIGHPETPSVMFICVEDGSILPALRAEDCAKAQKLALDYRE